jgi:hypothetical protein
MYGSYRIESLIGLGGMGGVYRAVDTRLDRKVAIKVSRTSFSDRFEREARTLSSLNHPHICTLFDVGPNYLVMELLEGTTLAARIAQGPLPIEEIVRSGADHAAWFLYAACFARRFAPHLRHDARIGRQPARAPAPRAVEIELRRGGRNHAGPVGVGLGVAPTTNHHPLTRSADRDWRDR